MSCNNLLISNPFEIANVFANCFEKVSGTQSYSPLFLQIKSAQEQNPLNFYSENDEYYNQSFTMWELEYALSRMKSSSPGPDNIHSLMLKNLNPLAKTTLLGIINNIWQSDTLPVDWKRAIMIPILKANMNPQSAENYRPISLTCCTCKLMERMVNKRLSWILEDNELISSYQCGFRPQRSCIDHLARLETYIHNAFINKEHVVAIFFDLQKAFDTVWRFSVLKKLHDWGIKGHLGFFIKNFLSDRKFQVRIGNTLSRLHNLENGIPQGSVLSCTLFSIAINDICKVIKHPVQKSLFVDDLTVYLKSKNLNYLRVKLQSTINSVSEWALANGFTLSNRKSCCVHFCRLRTPHQDPPLSLGGNNLAYRDNTKFLGLIFDRRMNWNEHISQLKVKCTRSMSLIKTLKNTYWGADANTLLRIYRSIIRSKIDYGSPIYGSAKDNVLKKLDSIHNMGVRFALGAFRTSPIASLLAESGEPPLKIRRELLSSGYVIKIRSQPSHPTFKTLFGTSNYTKFQRNPNSSKPLALRATETINLENVSEQQVSIVNYSRPPWTITKPLCIWDLSTSVKSATCSEIFQSKLMEIFSRFPNFKQLYTDGSKMGSNVGCAVTSDSSQRYFRLPANTSIFNAELKALEIALITIKKGNILRSLIISDSKSAIEALLKLYSFHPLIQTIQTLHDDLVKDGKKIVFVWVPSHKNIVGNDIADRFAKLGASKESPDFLTTFYEDNKTHVRKLILSNWESSWTNAEGNALRTVKNNVFPLFKYDRCRREQVILTRLRIGHCFFNKGHLINRQTPPWCLKCSVPITVAHVLTECPLYQQERLKNGLVNKGVDTILTCEKYFDGLFQYLKDVRLYNTI